MSRDGAKSAARRSGFWLITKRDNGAAAQAFTTEDAGGIKTLPLFSFEDEARLYLRLGDLGPGWSPEETPSAQLTSLLLGLYAGTVALDPLPGKLGEELLSLVTLGRHEFLRAFLDEPEEAETVR